MKKALLLLPLLFLFGCSPTQEKQTVNTITTTATIVTETGSKQDIIYKDYMGEDVSCGGFTGTVTYQSGYVIIYKRYNEYTKSYEEETTTYTNCVRQKKKYKHMDMVDLYNKYK